MADKISRRSLLGLFAAAPLVPLVAKALPVAAPVATPVVGVGGLYGLAPQNYTAWKTYTYAVGPAQYEGLLKLYGSSGRQWADE